MPTQKPLAALSPNAQAVYAALTNKPQSAEAIADRVADEMSAAESWDALQELEGAVRASHTFGGWDRLD